MRAAFLTSLDLAYEAIQLEKRETTGGDELEEVFNAVASKCEAAHALAVTVDAEFLKWVNPGLPEAYSEFTAFVKNKASGMRKDDMELQEKAASHWKIWAAFYAQHDEQIYDRLKVPRDQ